MKLLISIMLALPLLPRLCAAAQDAKVPRTEAKEVSFSVDGSFDRYGDSRDEQFGAGLDIDCASELKFRRSAFDWSLNLYYSYNRSETAGEASSANSAGLDLAKLMLVRWGGKELKTAKPYLLAGAEAVSRLLGGPPLCGMSARVTRGNGSHVRGCYTKRRAAC